MPLWATQLTYNFRARLINAQSSLATTKEENILLDADMTGYNNAFNPAELFLAALVACMIKGIERAAPTLKFELRTVEVRLHVIRQDAPLKIVSVDYELIIDTDECDKRLGLLHTNIRKYGTISNTVAEAVRLEGTIRRK